MLLQNPYNTHQCGDACTKSQLEKLRQAKDLAGISASFVRHIVTTLPPPPLPHSPPVHITSVMRRGAAFPGISAVPMTTSMFFISAASIRSAASNHSFDISFA